MISYSLLLGKTEADYLNFGYALLINSILVFQTNKKICFSFVKECLRIVLEVTTLYFHKKGANGKANRISCFHYNNL